MSLYQGLDYKHTIKKIFVFVTVQQRSNLQCGNAVCNVGVVGDGDWIVTMADE